MPHQVLLGYLPEILGNNPDNEVYLVPRVNTVEGLTDEHIKKWGWNVDDKGWVNYPDYQWRIWKNKPEIKWKNKVHEVLSGHKSYAALPSQEELALYHPKDIERQEKQNQLLQHIMISIIIPTYRNPEYLDICLKSCIEQQHYKNEIIVACRWFY